MTAPITTLTIAGTKTGLQSGGTETIGPYTITNAASGGGTRLAAAGGNNTVTVPSGGSYVGVLITPPPTSTVALVLSRTPETRGLLCTRATPRSIASPWAPRASSSMPRAPWHWNCSGFDGYSRAGRESIRHEAPFAALGDTTQAGSRIG